MRTIFFLFLLISSSAFAQSEKKLNKESDCDVLIKNGYTKEFCLYDQLYQFKNISFESKFKLVDSLMNLKRIEYWANVYDINSKEYLDWGITKFTRGNAKFQNGKFICVTLDLIDDKDKVPYTKFEAIINYLSGIFGKPKNVKSSNESNTWYEWKGTKLEINITYFGAGGTITLGICSNKLGSDKTLDNM